MIPKADGDSTPLGQRPLCVTGYLPSLGFGKAGAHSGLVLHLEYLTRFFSAGKGVSSVDAWYATSLDIEEVLSGTVEGHVHLFCSLMLSNLLMRLTGVYLIAP